MVPGAVFFLARQVSSRPRMGGTTTPSRAGYADEGSYPSRPLPGLPREELKFVTSFLGIPENLEFNGFTKFKRFVCVVLATTRLYRKIIQRANTKMAQLNPRELDELWQWPR